MDRLLANQNFVQDMAAYRTRTAREDVRGVREYTEAREQQLYDLGFDRDAVERDRGKGWKGEDFKTELAQKEVSFDQELEQLDQKAALDRTNRQIKYTDEQEQELKKIDTGHAKVDKMLGEGRLTQEEAAKAHNQFDLQAVAVKPRMVYTGKPEPTPQELYEKSRVVDTETGQTLFMDPKSGKFYTPSNPTEVARIKAEADRKADKSDLIAKLVTVTVEDMGGKKLAYSIDDARKLADEIYGADTQQTETEKKKDLTERVRKVMDKMDAETAREMSIIWQGGDLALIEQALQEMEEHYGTP